MKTTLLLVGKTASRLYAEGIDDYANRINHYIPFSIKVIPELKTARALAKSSKRRRKANSY